MHYDIAIIIILWQANSSVHDHRKATPSDYAEKFIDVNTWVTAMHCWITEKSPTPRVNSCVVLRCYPSDPNIPNQNMNLGALLSRSPYGSDERCAALTASRNSKSTRLFNTRHLLGHNACPTTNNAIRNSQYSDLTSRACTFIKRRSVRLNLAPWQIISPKKRWYWTTMRYATFNERWKVDGSASYTARSHIRKKLENIIMQSYRHADPRRQRPQVTQEYAAHNTHSALWSLATVRRAVSLTVWPCPLTFWPVGQSMPSDCCRVYLCQVWCW